MKPLPKVAVLLAAGRGKRLRPYTDNTPKPLLPVDGRPTLDFVMQAAANAGIERVCLVTHYLQEQIAAYVEDGSRWGMQAVCVHQPEMLGTAHALRCAVESQADWFNAPFLLSATDYLMPASFLKELVVLYGENSAEIVTSLKQLPLEQLIGRSSIRFSDLATYSIAEIVEKPPAGTAPSNYSANLIYILPPTIIPLLETIAPSPRGEYEIQAIINQLIAQGTIARGQLQTTPSEWQPPI